MLDVSAMKFQQQQDEPMSVVCNNEMPFFSTSNEWAYAMRRNMQEIIPGVFLGPWSSAQKHCLETILTHGITHIICVRQKVESHYIKPLFNDYSITYLTLEIADLATENIIRFFPKVRQFIEDALQRNGKVLVHGNTGISRSATLVLAYIMEKYGLTTAEAFECVKRRRGCIHPNEGFIAQLSEYEPIYKARQTLERGETSSHHETRRQKRKSEQLCETSADDYDLIQPPPSPISDYSDNNNTTTATIECPISTSEICSHFYNKLWQS